MKKSSLLLRRWVAIAAVSTMTAVLLLMLLLYDRINITKTFPKKQQPLAPLHQRRAAQEEQGCDSDATCQERSGYADSVCGENGKCTNPFRRFGCLGQLGLTEEMRQTHQRLCNSDDHADDYCRKSAFDYPEIRIHEADWETSIFQAWIYQIVLMEIAQAPATVGVTTQDTNQASLYSPQLEMKFSSETYPYEALVRGNTLLDCRETDLPCTHVWPEVWQGQEPEFSPLVENGTISLSGNGQVATAGFYIPIRLLRQYPALQGWLGYQGEANRELLAELFKRPLTWKKYCDTISPNQCAQADDTAAGYPEADEEGMFFADKERYTGYFHATPANNCTSGKETCTGHLITPPCTWSLNPDQRFFWNDLVGLDSVRDDGNWTYGWDELHEVWRAANATGSNIIMNRYKPDPFVMEFQDSDYAFQRITFPVVTRECLANRVSTAEKCHPDVTVRRGNALGACDTPPQQLLQLVTSNIAEYTLNADSVDRPPTHDVLKNLRIPETEIENIIRRWHDKGGGFGLQAREAVCEWVVERYDEIVAEVLPDFYPKRISRQSNHDAWWVYLALSIAIFGGLAAMMACSLVMKYRNVKVIVFAQPLFLNLILVGYMFDCIAAAVFVFEPTRGICLSSRWFRGLGSNMALVPIVIKTAAINSFVRSTSSSRRRTQRINISRSVLLTRVATVIGLLVTFYTLWTVYDPLLPTNVVFLNRNDPQIVEHHLRCESEGGSVWTLISFAWDILLLFIAAVLAFQTRGLIEQFNESRSLGTLVYSNSLFMVLQAIFIFFYYSEEFSTTAAAVLVSVSISLNAIFAMVIYVVPKLMAAQSEPEPYRRSPSTTSPSWRLTSTRDDSFGELTILNCTANIGNAEPTKESMEAWIPPKGECQGIKPLEGESIQAEYFDLIAIGMQESTWKEKEKREISGEKENLSEEDILNALEEHHTAKLREMIADVLGDQYVQIAEDQRGQMRLYVYALVPVADGIDKVRIGGANTGIGNVLANKGGIVVTVEYKKTRISFLSAHLAAHEGDAYYSARCDNIRTILKESKTYDLNKKLDAALSSHHVFVMGDLNFRTKFDEPDASHEENVQRALDLIAQEDYAGLYSFDELHKGVEKGELLCGFETLPCHFPPTFKVLRKEGIEYKKQRTPSYTDRILYKSAPGLNGYLTPLSYEPCIDFITSDHKPMRGAFTIYANEYAGRKQIGGEVELIFRNMSCSDLPAGDARVGTSDLYLMFLWDGIELEPEHRGLMDTVRTLLGSKSWPRTRWISRSLNPSWGDEKIKLTTKSPFVGVDAMLFVAAMSFDTFLGAVALNVKELVTMTRGQKTKELQTEMPLKRCGVDAGSIKFSLDVNSGSGHRRFSLIQSLRASSSRHINTTKPRPDRLEAMAPVET